MFENLCKNKVSERGCSDKHQGGQGDHRGFGSSVAQIMIVAVGAVFHRSSTGRLDSVFQMFAVICWTRLTHPCGDFDGSSR